MVSRRPQDGGVERPQPPPTSARDPGNLAGLGVEPPTLLHPCTRPRWREGYVAADPKADAAGKVQRPECGNCRLATAPDCVATRMGVSAYVFLYLRNVKGFGWNHKLVYRVCRELAFNMRIKPKKRLVREKPGVLAVRQAINQTWLLSRLLLGLPRRQALFALMRITNQQAPGLPDSSIDPQPSIDLTGAPFVRLVRSRSTCPVP